MRADMNGIERAVIMIFAVIAAVLYTALYTFVKLFHNISPLCRLLTVIILCPVFYHIIPL